MAGGAQEPAPAPRVDTPADVRTLDDLALLLRKLRRREARQREGAELTYRSLAAKAGWSHGLVAAYFTGKILPPTDRFDTLVRLLGATASEQGALATARDRVEELGRAGRAPSGTPAASTAGAGSAASVPRQLPADVAGFTGRRAELAGLDSWLATVRPSHAPMAVAVTGTAGVGKTAFAVHWAHRHQDRFPDGQLHLDLRGYAPTVPLRPVDALGQFLRALGVPADGVPADPQEAAGLYRSLLADRRVLVVLDNASNADQVRPLLPGGRGCVALVTSRDRLDGLVAREGVHRLTLDVLAPAEAQALLTWTVGADRLAGQPDAVAELTRSCAYLPLALRIAAANLTTRTVDVATYLSELRSDGELAGLAVIGDDQTAVRTAFSLSYAALPGDARRLFRLLGALPGADVTTGAAAAAAGTSPAQARRLLDQLAAAHLAQEATPDRFTCHDLLRCYAAELATAAPATEREAAITGLYDWYLATVEAATGLLYPEKVRLLAPAQPRPEAGAPLEVPAQALAWLEGERRNLVLAAQHAAAHGPRPVAWLLADALRGYFHARPHLLEWEAVCRAGLAAAQAEEDLRGQSATQLGLADYHHRQHRYQLAIDHYAQAARLAEHAAWPAGEATAITHLAAMYGETGRLAQAEEHLRRALDLHRRTGSLPGQAASLGNLGVTCFELGELDRAAGYFQQALELDGRLGSRIGRAQTLNNLGEVYLLTGEPELARARLTEALGVFREVGNRAGEVQSLALLADAHRHAGEHREAAELAGAALGLAREGPAQRQDALAQWSEALALNALAAAHSHTGQPQRAIAEHERALELVRQGGNPYPEATTQLALAGAHHASGRLDRAATHARQALEIARDRGYRLVESTAAELLAAL